jgi:hypothetical protein
MYLLDNYIGELILTREPGDDGYFISKETRLSVERLGQDLDLLQILEINTDMDLNAKSFIITTFYPDGSEIISGTIQNGLMRVKDADYDEEYSIEFEGVDFETVFLYKLMQNSDYLSDIDTEINLFYPEVIEVVPTEFSIIKENGKQKLHIMNDLGDTQYLFDEYMELVEIRDNSLGFPLIVIRKDNIDVNEYDNTDKFDLIKDFSISLEGEYNNEDSFVISIRGVIPPEYFPDSDFQFVEKISEMQFRVMLGERQPSEGEYPGNYLQKGYPYFPEDEKIKSISKRITEDVETEEKKARKITRWVQDEINCYDLSHIYSDAIKVLEDRGGDCSELSTLLVGLLRSAGIPARTSIGLTLYYDNNFYLHMWVEAFHDGAWHSYDPTLMDMNIPHIKIAHLPPDGEIDGGMVVNISRIITGISVEVDK